MIDELSSHTDTNRQQLIHPYKVRFLGKCSKCSNRSVTDNLRSEPEQRPEGQPRGELGGGLQHPDVRDEDVRAGVSQEEDGGRDLGVAASSRGSGSQLSAGVSAVREQQEEEWECL